MADTIKTRAELEADFADGQFRTMTAQKIRNFLASLGVGGTMFALEVPLSITAAWEPVTIFTDSVDTRGINEDLVTGEFVAGAGADGVFAVDVAVGLNYMAGAPVSLDFAITKNGALTPYRMPRDMSAGDSGSVSIVGSGNLVEGDRIGLAVKGSAIAAMTATVQYRAIRG
jgi:hypothetical protein